MRRKRRRRSETRLLEAHVVSMRIKKRLLSASERKTFFVVKESLYQHFHKNPKQLFKLFVRKRYEDAQKKKRNGSGERGERSGAEKSSSVVAVVREDVVDVHVQIIVLLLLLMI